MKKLLFLAITINLFSIAVFGQAEYFFRDGVRKAGIKLVDAGNLTNCKVCQWERKDGVVIMTPYEVEEYAFLDGRVYVSKEIQTVDSAKRVFLERLSTGKVTLYYYKGDDGKKYFLEKENAFFSEIPKKSKGDNHYYKSALTGLLDSCPAAVNNIKLASYNKFSLSALIRKYNQCDLKSFPFLKFGISGGYVMEKLTPANKNDEYLSLFDYKYEKSFLVGAFIDLPIKSNGYSFRAEANYSQNEFSYSYSDGYKKQQMDITTKSIMIPLLIRYTYPVTKSRPFINSGLIYSHYLKNECAYATSLSDEYDSVQNELMISNNMLGFVLGGGYQINLNYRSSVSIECRYNKLYSQMGAELLNVNQLQFITSINFR